MGNKEIQEARMKSYFLQAAKEILKAEGLKALSVRSVSEKAGYSYATLYNYFKDIGDLLYQCIGDFQQECEVFAHNRAKNETLPALLLRKTILGYMHYFVEYPGVFELFYLNRMGEAAYQSPALDAISLSLDKVCGPVGIAYAQSKQLDSEALSMLMASVKFTVLGMLLLYLNRNAPTSYDAFFAEAEKQINALLP